MKKFLTLMLIGVLAVSLSCFDDDDDKDKDDPSGSKSNPIQLTIGESKSGEIGATSCDNESYSSKYYFVNITASQAYTIRLYNMSADFDLYVYKDSSYEEASLISSSENLDTTEDIVNLTDAQTSGLTKLYIEIYNGLCESSGGTFSVLVSQ